jgi:hypothetical protein
MRKLLVGAAFLAGVHYGYKAITGECPCTLRRQLQLKLALLLIQGLEREGYLELYEEAEPLDENARYQLGRWGRTDGAATLEASNTFYPSQREEN